MLWNRTTSFSLIEAISYTTNFLAPVIGSSLMLTKPAAPFIWSISCFILAYIPTCLLRASLTVDNDENQNRRNEGAASEPLLSDVGSVNPGEFDPPEPNFETSDNRSKSLLAVLHNRDLVLCLAAVFVTALARMCMNFLLPYISRRYDWSTAKVIEPSGNVYLIFSG